MDSINREIDNCNPKKHEILKRVFSYRLEDELSQYVNNLPNELHDTLNFGFGPINIHYSLSKIITSENRVEFCLDIRLDTINILIAKAGGVIYSDRPLEVNVKGLIYITSGYISWIFLLMLIQIVIGLIVLQIYGLNIISAVYVIYVMLFSVAIAKLILNVVDYHDRVFNI